MLRERERNDKLEVYPVSTTAREATRKIGYTDVKACQLEVIAGVVNCRDVSRLW